MKREKIDLTRVVSIDVDGIDMRDYPDFCDAYICYAEYEEEDGTFRDLTEAELEEINEDSSFVYEAVMDRIY